MPTSAAVPGSREECESGAGVGGYGGEIQGAQRREDGPGHTTAVCVGGGGN